MDQYQEVLEIRTATVRLVSHLAQLPSSAIHFKDVLLSLPTTHRQQLQVRGCIHSDLSNKNFFHIPDNSNLSIA